ncbi:MAG: hypothetical protein J0L93_09630 [Deltaproteobacteria bacterium]|nr:hypothetical protein [Deltaproteobacteria bacterium]
MRKSFLILFIFFVFFKNSNAFSEQSELVRFSNDEARAIGIEASQNLQMITNYLVRVRELAQLASNPTMGATDRNYLNSEKSFFLDDIKRLINQTDFQDSFRKQYFYLKDGLEFTSLSQSTMGGEEIPMKYKIEPITDRSFGQIAKKEFFLSSDQNTEIQLNGARIFLNRFSAEEAVDAINSISYQTGVNAVPSQKSKLLLWSEKSFEMNGEKVSLEEKSVFNISIGTLDASQEAYFYLKSALDDLRLRLASVSLIVQASPPQ